MLTFYIENNLSLIPLEIRASMNATIDAYNSNLIDFESILCGIIKYEFYAPINLSHMC